MSLAPSRKAGDTVESTVVQVHPELRHVPDSQHEHHDAVVTELLTPSRELPFVGICLLEVGTIVEIKSAMVVYGEAQRRGRFLLRRSQHEHLLDEGGVYLFAVCAPTPDRDIIVAKVVPATLVDEFEFSWVERATRFRSYLRSTGPREVLATVQSDADERPVWLVSWRSDGRFDHRRIVLEELRQRTQDGPCDDGRHEWSRGSVVGVLVCDICGFCSQSVTDWFGQDVRVAYGGDRR